MEQANHQLAFVSSETAKQASALSGMNISGMSESYANSMSRRDYIIPIQDMVL
jgi:hypothetical protein